MITAAVLATSSALLGGAIALVARRRPEVLERTRTFAFAAAAGVVAFHLLPEILPDQGAAALLFVAIGFALPWALEAGARSLGPTVLEHHGLEPARLAAEVGFAALLVHSLVEGMALVSALSSPGSKLDLEVALVAHHAPLTAAVTLPFLGLLGPRSVLRRAGVTALVGVIGVLLSRAIPGFTADAAIVHKALSVTAGALLHVVADEIQHQRFASRRERAADVLACAAGLLVAGVSAWPALREPGAPLRGFFAALLPLSLLAAAPVLVAAVAAGPLRRLPLRLDALLIVLLGIGTLPAAACAAASVVAGERPRSNSLRAAVRRRAPALLVLLVGAAGLELAAPRLELASPGGLALLAALWVCARFDPAGGAVVATVLATRGLPPVACAAIVGAAPAQGLRAVLLLPLVALCAFLPAGPAPLSLPVAVNAAALAALCALGLGALWQEGPRGFFLPLRHADHAPHVSSATLSPPASPRADPRA